MTQYKVYKGFPYSFTARKARYYNLTGSGVANDDTTLTYEMTPYAGLDTTVEYTPPAVLADTSDVSDTELTDDSSVNGSTTVSSYRNLVTVAEGELPDYDTFTGGQYCFGTTGASYLVYDSDADTCIEVAGGLAEGLTDDGSLQYYNIWKRGRDVVFDTAETKSGYSWIGELSIPTHQTTILYQPDYTLVGDLKVDTNYWANGFSSSSCFYSPAIGLAGSNNYFITPSWKVITKVYLTSLDDAVICNQDNGDFCYIKNSTFKLYDGSGKGSVAATTNEWWWIQCLWDANASTYYLYVLKDNFYTLDTLPDVSEWQLSGSSSKNIASTSKTPISFGRSYDSGYYSQYIRGKIDLTATAVYEGNVLPDGTDWTTVWTALK